MSGSVRPFQWGIPSSSQCIKFSRAFQRRLSNKDRDSQTFQLAAVSAVLASAQIEISVRVDIQSDRPVLALSQTLRQYCCPTAGTVPDTETVLLSNCWLSSTFQAVFQTSSMSEMALFHIEGNVSGSTAVHLFSSAD